MVQTDEYQDPILTFGNVRRFVENMPGKTKVCIELHSMSTKIQAIWLTRHFRWKHHHEAYIYNSNSDNFETEINEFFKYTEITIQLQDFRRSFEKTYGKYYPQQIVPLLDQLELTDQEKRLKSSQHLTYIALGCFTSRYHESKEQRKNQLIRNNQSLINAGAFFVIFQKLQQSCLEYDTLSNR